MSLIELHQVVKEYAVGETRITALRGIDLAIGVGECVAIWRPSGSGKSTLCNLIGMLDSATSGTVRLAGQDVSALSDDQRSALRNQAIGVIFQNVNMLPVLSALENVLLPLQLRGVSAREAQAQARQSLTMVRLAEHMTRRPAQLPVSSPPCRNPDHPGSVFFCELDGLGGFPRLHRGQRRR